MKLYVRFVGKPDLVAHVVGGSNREGRRESMAGKSSSSDMFLFAFEVTLQSDQS